jgi:hypothetical protein
MFVQDSEHGSRVYSSCESDILLEYDSKRDSNRGGNLVKIIAYDRFKPGVTMDTITPLLPEEVGNVWKLWKAGIVRENYARADEPGVIIVFECASVEECQQIVSNFPLTKAGYLEWFYIPVTAPLPLESLYDPTQQHLYS